MRVSPHLGRSSYTGRYGTYAAGIVAEVAAFADGVIVGSAFVRGIAEAATPAAAVAAVRELTADLAQGVRRG